MPPEPVVLPIPNSSPRLPLLAGTLILALGVVAPTWAQTAPSTPVMATEPAAEVAPAPVAIPAQVAIPEIVEAPVAELPTAPLAADTPDGVDTPAEVAPTGTSAGTTLGMTQAEHDFSALYGQPYDPVADPTLPAAAQIGTAYDPWERYNRRMHRFNNAVDRTVARPLALTYQKVMPRPVRLGVRNFFNNLRQPVSAVNALLQGKPKAAGQSLGRFALNSTLGIGGIFDPASDADLPNRSEDFGQTLGIWGWEHSRYVELPLFGPRTVRDAFGMVGDAPLSPVRQIEEDTVRIGLQGLQLVDVRTQLLAVDALREGAADDYALVRDAWMQRRNYQIFGERSTGDDGTLPDYLLDDENPTVPVDAMPVMPTDN